MQQIGRTIHLDSMDGFEFEGLCKTIFERLDYGRVEEQPLTGDGGKDLVILAPGNKIVVECKHQPNTSIGRPVIQKLHSAVISEGAASGIVVTTGGFSRQAIEHAAKLRPHIELVDMAKLRDLASRAGIHLVYGGESAPIYTYRPLVKEEVSDALSNHLTRGIVSHPAKISDVLHPISTDISLRPVYHISYSVDAVFATSVGVVHQEKAAGEFLMDGGDGMPVDEGMARYYSTAPGAQKVRWEDIASDSGIDDRPFRIPVSVIKERALDTVVTRHTRTIMYRGRNNQRYTRVCAPVRNDVQIRNISQEYIPEYHIAYELAGRGQKFGFACNGGENIHVMHDPTARCPLCSPRAAPRMMSLCNDCGLVTCTRSSLFMRRRHSHRCSVCGMTLCPSCASYVRRFLVLKKIVCKDCSDKFAKRGKRARGPIRKA